MNDTPTTINDTLTRGLIISIFLGMAIFIVYAWVQMSKETGGWVEKRTAAKAEITRKRASQLEALSQYSVSYTGDGRVDTAKPVAIPIEEAMKLVLRDAAPEAQAQPRGPEAEGGARAAYPTGAALYARDCASCHGASAQGGIVVRPMSEVFRTFVATRAMTQARISSMDALATRLSGGRHVPVFGAYTGTQWAQLHGYLMAIATVAP